jgi:hypothetical protein
MGGLLFGESDSLFCFPYGDGDRCLAVGENEYLRAAGEVFWFRGCLGGDQGDNFRPDGECLAASLLGGERDKCLRKEGDLDICRLGVIGDL